MKTYDVVAAAIEAQKTGRCFALLGDGNMHFAGALAHLGMPFTYVVPKGRFSICGEALKLV